MATMASLHTEPKTLQPSTSFSSLSLSSKNLLSFTKSRKSNPPKVKSKLRPEESQGQQTRSLQGNARQVSIRDSIVVREPTYFGKRTSIRKRSSSRLAASSSVNRQSGTFATGRTSRLFTRHKASGPELVRGPTPEGDGRGASARTLRTGIMRRITRRLHSPQREEDEAGELPIQRVPSVRRQSSRLSHRSSRVRSYRSSSYRPPSTRLSRTVSGLSPSGYNLNTSARPPSIALYAIGSALGQDDDSNYSTESEEEAPITMRSARLQRVRASTVVLNGLGISPVVEQVHIRVEVPPAQTQLTDLIEEIAEELEGRPSRDTIDSTWDFSLDHYCNAFPAPPSPGVASNALFTSSDKIHKSQASLPSTNNASPVPPPSQFSAPPSPEPTKEVALDAPASASTPQFKLDIFGTTSNDWNAWSFPDASTSLRLNSIASSRSSIAKSDHMERTITPSSDSARATPSRVVHQQQKSSTSTALSSIPVTPATPSFARTRSIDPLGQARRKTRIVSGHVLEGADFDLLAINDAVAKGLQGGRNSPLWWDSSTGSPDEPPLSERRGSDKSSIFSLPTPGQPESHIEEVPTVSFDNVYSLNSPNEESTEIGVALTTEFRELASPSPISFAQNDDSRLTLFARRKGRKSDEITTKGHLRVEPPPPLPSLPENAPSAATSYENWPAPSTYGSKIITNRNETAPGRIITPSPPSSAPPKRKSFFRYPFSSSSRRSSSALKLSTMASTRTASPPLPSPTAVAPPMSASAGNPSFPLKRPMTAPGSSGSSSTMQGSKQPVSRSIIQSKFKSFSRPSSSGKHI